MRDRREAFAGNGKLLSKQNAAAILEQGDRQIDLALVIRSFFRRDAPSLDAIH